MTRSNYIFLAIGAAIGSVCTWMYVRNYYSKIAQEEIDSVRAAYKKLYSEVPEEETESEDVQAVEEIPAEKPDIMEYAKMLAQQRYAEEGNVEKKELKEDAEHPYVISPTEFGEFQDYETISLTYYADHILTDEDDEIVENMEEIVGSDSLTHFGEYEDDSVFVRNDRLQCDYEILMDLRTYAEVVKGKPHHTED